MDSSLLRVKRRLNQGLQLLFSPRLTSSQAANDALEKRYGSAKELEFYKSVAHSGFDDFEEKAINAALENFSAPPTVLVIGCGTGREAFAFEQLGCQVTGIDPVSSMIEFAKSQKSNCHFKVGNPFSIPSCHFDLVYISAALNGHIFGKRERLRFYRRLRNFCHDKTLLISIPEIHKMNRRSHFYFASLVMRIRHFADGNWQPGDTARSFLGNHNDDGEVLYYHYYPDYPSFASEMASSGFRDFKEKYIFHADQKFKPQITHVGKYFPPDNHGGMESSLYDLSVGATHAGFAVKAIVNAKSALSSRETIDGVDVIRCARQGKFSSSPISASYLKALTAIDTDLIHLHTPNPMAAMTGLASETPLVVSYHCDVLSYPLLFQIYKPLLEQQLKHARAIVVSSPHLIESSEILKPFREKCAVIPFGIDPRELKVRQNIQTALRELKNVFGKPLLLFVGRLVSYKGLEYLVRAMKDIDALLAIVGDGPELAPLKAQTRKLHLDEKIHFFGNVSRSDLGSYYKECDAFVLPSIDAREAFGICLIEALAFGKPLITTQVGTGVNFVNQDGITGFSVPPKNAKTLSEKINQLLQDATLYEKLATNARSRFQTHFTRDQMISSLGALYIKILGHQLAD